MNFKRPQIPNLAKKLSSEILIFLTLSETPWREKSERSMSYQNYVRTRKIKDSKKCCSAFCHMSGEKKGRILLLSFLSWFFAAARAFPALVAIFRIESRDMAGLGAPPTLAEVLSSSPATDVRLVDAQLLWGPIDARKSAEAGATRPTSSIALAVAVPESLRQAVLAQVPYDVLPQAGDTVKSLVARLAACAWLEDSHVLKRGAGPQRVRLNATSYAQPRRRSYSVVVRPSYEDEHGERVSDLLCYTSYGRLPSDWEAIPMPRPIYELGHWLWSIAFHLLSDVSKQSPPTACQLLMYYTLFGSSMGRHRDNYTSQQMVDVVLGAAKFHELVPADSRQTDANSQQINSNVLVYTEGVSYCSVCACTRVAPKGFVVSSPLATRSQVTLI